MGNFPLGLEERVAPLLINLIQRELEGKKVADFDGTDRSFAQSPGSSSRFVLLAHTCSGFHFGSGVCGVVELFVIFSRLFRPSTVNMLKLHQRL